MTGLAGTGKLIRFIARRERVRLSVWLLVLASVPIVTADAFIELYPTAASREALLATVATSPALTALLGPLLDPGIGGLTAWRSGTLGAFFVALMAILTMVRHTREEEETGRRELLGSTVLGRHAPLAAASVVTIGAGVVLGGALAAGLTGVGLPAAGSIAFGFGFTGVAVAFAGVGALAAQLTEASSTARGVGVAVAGLAFALRMGGDTGGEGLEWMSWLSPIGWFSRLQPFAGERWWVLALWISVGAVMAITAVAIASSRDVGAGAFPPRPGPARAGAGLRGVFGLAWRLHRGSVIGWAFGLAALGAVYGGAGESIGDMLEGNPQLQQIFEQLGGEQGLTDAYFSAVLGIIAIVTAAYAIRAVLRLRVEEEGLRADPLLATATPRTRWAWSHLVFGLVVPAMILALAGLFAGVTYGAITGDLGAQVPRVLGAAVVQLPAVWVLTGTAMALYGIAPRRVGLSWAVLVACLILGQLGQILRFPQWSLNLSPFSHVPRYPAQDIEALPLLVLLCIATALIATGLLAFRRRDVDGG
ncbi:MAG: ABC transporter permease [Acidimicrobiia bacterium]